MTGNDIAIDSLGFLSEPFDERGGVSDLALGFREWLALLGRHEYREVFLVRQHQVVPAAQDAGALLRGFLRPRRHRACGRCDGAARFARSHMRHRAELLAGRGILYVDGRAGIGIDPFAVDEGLGAQQRGVFEIHGGSPPASPATYLAKNSRVRCRASAALLGS